MRIGLGCIPCFLRQAFEAGALVTDDQEIRERILREVLSRLTNQSFDKTPPSVGRDIHRIVKLLSGDNDPYLEIKRNSNYLAMRLMPALKELIRSSADPFETAVRLAIAGNMIDYGQGDRIGEEGLRKTVFQCLDQPVSKDSINELREEIEKASNIVYLGDNAGEVFFDRLLIEELEGYPIKFVVRGVPIINDALKEDAKMVGLDKLVRVVDNGSDVPGTILEECSQEFKGQFREADLVIAKGQGNYETLSDEQKKTFFLLKVKCSVVSEHIGYQEGDMVIVRSG
ncbi:MAG: DUF89 family protein [Deltaproteobacteria bacterium]|nr:MAG: DUF89 family protein [Deltaproteobacteria bacterium]